MDDVGDVVSETHPDEWDHVGVHISNYALPANVEAASIDEPGAGNLTGNALNNFLGTSPGNNVFDGGDGYDTVSYEWNNNGSGVTVSLAVTGPQNTGGSGTDTLLNIEQLHGSHFNDHLSGDDGNNRLEGKSGNDTLLGAGGNDDLFGDDGNDALQGDAGNDNLNGGTGADTMTGGAGNDWYQVDDAGDEGDRNPSG